MNNTENDKNVKTEASKKQEGEASKKPEKKTQSQLLQQALGLRPEDIQEIEKKLFIARFIDYFAEIPLDFIYRDRSIENYKNEIIKFFDSDLAISEEDKLLRRSFEDKQIIEIIYQLKKKAEDTALEKGGIKKPVDKRLRKLSLLITLPMFGVVLILSFLLMDYIWFIIPLLCVFCMAPQFVRGSILRKWHRFKEENKNEFYAENRDDIMILKGYIGEILDNIRSRLLEMKVPLQLIKFVLHSRDYENLKLLSHKAIRGTEQYFFSFEYPPDMEPFPIPEILLQTEQQIAAETKPPLKPEKNFVVLTDLIGKNGVLTSFLPRLRTPIAEKINDMLNNCDFTTTPKKFNEIVPNSQNMPIYCICGKIAEFLNIQICNWKNQFKFYLFESSKCRCGEKIYVLSLMDDSDEVPDEFKEIFSS